MYGRPAGTPGEMMAPMSSFFGGMGFVSGGDSKMPEGIYIRTSDSPAVKVVAKDIFDKFNVKAEEVVEASTQK